MRRAVERLFLLPVLLFALGSPARAHDGLPITVTLAEQPGHVFRASLLLPPAVPEAQRPRLSLSSPCRPVSLRDFACPGGLDGARLGLEWPAGIPSLAILVRVGWRDGQQATTVSEVGAAEVDLPRREEAGQVFLSYFRIGLEHILFGWDHLLFVACLALMAARPRRIALMVTGFTLGHAVTITAASLGLAGLPIAPVEAVIALSIMALAAEIARGERAGLLARYPIAISAGFGLLHGFGFASALTGIGLPRSELGMGLLAFNLGIELGQLAFVAALWGVTRLPRPAAANAVTLRLVFAVLVGSTAAYWLITRIPALGA